MMSAPARINALEVLKAGEFGKLYFNIDENYSVETKLRLGVALCYEGEMSVITEIIKLGPDVVIRVYRLENNVIHSNCVKIIPRMYIRTDFRYFSRVTHQGRLYALGTRVYLAAQHAAGNYSLKQADGVIEKIFSYEGIASIFLCLQTRVISARELYGAIQLNANDHIELLASQINAVGVGTRVHAGVVVGILYFKVTPFIPMGYIIRKDDGTIFTADYRDRILPVEMNTQNINMLKSYHELSKAENEIFLHQGMALKKVQDNLVEIVRAASHQYAKLCFNSSPVNGYLAFDESISWSEYGFTCEPSESQTVVCCLTGKVTVTDFE